MKVLIIATAVVFGLAAAPVVASANELPGLRDAIPGVTYETCETHGYGIDQKVRCTRVEKRCAPDGYNTQCSWVPEGAVQPSKQTGTVADAAPPPPPALPPGTPPSGENCIRFNSRTYCDTSSSESVGSSALQHPIRQPREGVGGRIVDGAISTVEIGVTMWGLSKIAKSLPRRGYYRGRRYHRRYYGYMPAPRPTWYAYSRRPCCYGY